MLLAQSCPTFCDPMDCNLPDSFMHRILQARILEWVAIYFSRGSSPPRNRTRVSPIAGRFFAIWDTREALLHPVLCVCACVPSCVWLFPTPWTIACQTPLSMKLCRQEHWSPGNLPDPVIKRESPTSPTLAGGFSTTEPIKLRKDQLWFFNSLGYFNM